MNEPVITDDLIYDELSLPWIPEIEDPAYRPRYIEAPRLPEIVQHPTVFLAGGITNCPDWQKVVRVELRYITPLTLINPRRANFPMDRPEAAKEQIKWEHMMLRFADVISFWFPEETLCPITLYELGAWSHSKKPILVGTHPNYKRRTDVLIQTRLARPEVEVVDSLDELIDQIRMTPPPVERPA